MSYFALGGLLNRIIEDKTYIHFGFTNFQDYVESEVGFTLRKAMYLIDIFRKLSRLSIPKERVLEVGWTKAKTIVKVLDNENADVWIEHAKTVSSVQLEKDVKAAIDQVVPDGPAQEGNVVRFSVKLQDEQIQIVNNAVDRAMSDLTTDSRGYALQMVCMEWLGSRTGNKERKLQWWADMIEKTYGVKVNITEG